MRVNFVLIALFQLCWVTQGEKCGGVLEGDYGNFRYDGSKPERTPEASNCIWVIQVPRANRILFTVSEFRSNSDLLLYPGDALSECVLSKIRVSTHTSFSVLGGTLIALLPDTGATISFTWETEQASDGSGDVTTDFIESTDGRLGWVPQKRKENFLWVLQLDGPAEIEWNATVRYGKLDGSDLHLPCNIFTVCIIEVSEESLMEVDMRICRSSFGTMDSLSSQVIVVGSTNLREPHDATVEVSWVSEGRSQTTTDHTTTTHWTTTTPTTTDPTTTTPWTTTTPTTTDPTTTTPWTTTTPTTTDPTTTTPWTTTTPTTTDPTTTTPTTTDPTTTTPTTIDHTTTHWTTTTTTPRIKTTKYTTSTSTTYPTAAPAALSHTKPPSQIPFINSRVHNARRKRKNHCARNLCSHICIPTSRSFRCFCPEGMWLDFDDLSCLTYNPRDNQI